MINRLTAELKAGNGFENRSPESPIRPKSITRQTSDRSQASLDFNWFYNNHQQNRFLLDFLFLASKICLSKSFQKSRGQ